ncbi:MAG: hypothetical protein H0X27_02285 [Caulobacteraceae bacterium]|nr:hypothetical protein [Caulobacteraceae bacterium]
MIKAATGSIVRLESAMIIGGTLNTAGTGVVEASGGSALDGSGSTVHNQGELKVIDGDSLAATGVIDNTGAIALAGTSSGSALVVSGNLTLQGGGSLSLADVPGSLITGPTFSDTLSNVDNTIAGDGQIGGGQMTLVNQSKGFIEEPGATGLTIDTGSTAIINAGEIRALGSGGILIQSAVTNSGVIAADGAGALTITAKVKNTGLLEANGGTLIDYEAVNGKGSAAIAAGSLEFMSSFNQDVAFTGSSGTLELAKSQAYTATIIGFSQAGGTFLDLADIKFTGKAGQASFVDNGSHTGGVLTVTDGIHTAHINLVGDYHTSTFVVANDGNGKVLVHDPAATDATLTAPGAHPFIAAMASFGAHPGGPAQLANDTHFARPAMLSVPRMAMA